MGGAESREAHQKIHKASLDGVTFPKTLELNYDPSWKKLKLSLDHGSQPLYMFNLPQGWWGDLIMYNGPTLDSPPLAAVRNSGKTAMGNVVTLPPLGPGQEVIEEKMSRRTKRFMDLYSFTVPVPQREGEKTTRRVERFEWVGTGGKEVKDLHEWVRGWKLRRVVESYADAYAGSDDEKDEDGDVSTYENTDGEILAVWADATGLSKKAAKFEFINSGATGELGEAWAVMAVITFVRVWQRYMQVVMV
ncbi:hypothetical protein N5P37_007803 [Trichoderma harzianum]|uniref:Uncharacterized protein n=1 Tax=Trichoderma harzianum CBS 226.95 TaxID=983964 RepID=A0A2T4A411_TRIHA|nr:hypothetical protein M431DRAFT_510958 [Trichoderma harzianum CBS 226.95]KAK0759615.1 hypothetical protein N5P37_007803 [Trichoderma harzianum]PKK53282.1 hypothetical protein CI102_3532 [Trichoderma harzianum]PTB51815.1 hypothetical protein M431DRAFT_510958 [Trichoderma harzianum CBS 226.95]